MRLSISSKECSFFHTHISGTDISKFSLKCDIFDITQFRTQLKVNVPQNNLEFSKVTHCHTQDQWPNDSSTAAIQVR